MGESEATSTSTSTTQLNRGRAMFTRKWVVRVVMLVIACVVVGGAVTGCESTGGGRGSDGHAGHNH